jgi:hypothetical protein
VKPRFRLEWFVLFVFALAALVLSAVIIAF